MINTRLTIEGYEVDLTNDVPVPLNLGIVDIKDLDKRTTEFTKTIKVPGTKNNNKIFGHIFDLQTDNDTGAGDNVFENFDPTKKASAVLSQGDYAISSGYIQLRNINYQRDTIIYEVVFYGSLADFITALGDSELSDLDIDITHQPNFNTIPESWTNQKKYIYGMFDYGTTNIRTHAVRNLYQMIPAIKLKTYIDAIFSAAGYTYTAPFFDSGQEQDNQQELGSEFERFYVPYNGEESLLSTETELENNSILATSNNPLGEFYDFRGQETGSIDTSMSSSFEADEDILTKTNIDTGSFEFIAPQTGFYNISADILTKLYAEYVNLRGVSDDNLPENEVSFKDHYASVRVKVTDSLGNEKELTQTLDTENNERFVNSFSKTIYDLTDTLNTSGSQIVSASEFINIGNPDWATVQTTTRQLALSGSISPGYSFNIELENLRLLEDDRVSVEIEWYSPYRNDDGVFPSGGDDDESRMETPNLIVTDDGFWGFTRDQSSGDIVSNGDAMSGSLFIDTTSNLEVVPNPKIPLDTQITFDKIAPVDVKQSDFFLSVLKMFNLVAVTDPANRNNLIIEEKDKFLEKGEIKNWDDKIDYNKPYNVKPVRDPSIKEFEFTWAKGNDYFNRRYQEIYDEVYGEETITNSSQFGKGVKRNNIIFEPASVVKYPNDKVFNIQVQLANSEDFVTFETDNVDDLTQITGVGQTVQFVIDGQFVDKTIAEVNEKTFKTETNVTNINRGAKYGVIFTNVYDRHHVAMYDSDNDEENKNQKPVRTNPKLLYYAEKRSCNSWGLDNGIDKIPQTEYPYLSHLNSFPTNNPTFDYNFGKPLQTNFEISDSDYPTNNLYTRFHKKGVDNILLGSDILTAYFNLDIVDLVNLQYNDKIYLQGQIYYINRIYDFNLVGRGPVKIELYRITEGTVQSGQAPLLEFYDSGSITNYALSSDYFVTYDTTGSLATKAENYRDDDYAGMIAFDIADDDWINGHPLISTVSDIMTGSNKKSVGYFTSWPRYRKPPYNMKASDLDVQYYTDIIYFVMGIDSGSLEVETIEDYDLTEVGTIRNKIDNNNPSCKLLVGLGGWVFSNDEETRDIFPIVVDTTSSRQTFADNLVTFCRDNNVDGIELNWEHPGYEFRPGASADEIPKFTQLCAEISSSFASESAATGNPKLEIWSSVPASPSISTDNYERTELYKYLDYMTAQGYDFAGPWAPTVVNPHTPYTPVSGGLVLWTDDGTPKDQLLVGYGTYGRSWDGEFTTSTVYGDAAQAPGAAQPTSQVKGFATYFEIKDRIHNE